MMYKLHRNAVECDSCGSMIVVERLDKDHNVFVVDARFYSEQLRQLGWTIRIESFPQEGRWIWQKKTPTWDRVATYCPRCSS